MCPRAASSGSANEPRCSPIERSRASRRQRVSPERFAFAARDAHRSTTRMRVGVVSFRVLVERFLWGVWSGTNRLRVCALSQLRPLSELKTLNHLRLQQSEFYAVFAAVLSAFEMSAAPVANSIVSVHCFAVLDKSLRQARVGVVAARYFGRRTPRSIGR